MGFIFLTAKSQLKVWKNHSIENRIYRDVSTRKLDIQDTTGFTAPLEKVKRWKREGISDVYRNALNREVGVKPLDHAVEKIMN